jgi:release factor glutamine methyltransferase
MSASDAGEPATPGASEAPWTVGRLLTWTTGWLTSRGSESPRLDAEVLLAHVRACPRIALYTAFGETVPDGERARFRDLVRRRGAGEPVAYLVGQREFFSLAFAVSPAVLVPRPETEGLVVRAIDLCRAAPAGIRLLDVGTGSGAIAVAIAKHVTTARLVATDSSPEAIAVARDNAGRHGVADRIEFVTCDLVPSGGPWDVIVSNPPYVREDEFPSLPPDVRLHEPRTALVAGPTGVEVVTRLVDAAARVLVPGGWLLVEIGPTVVAAAEAAVAARPELAAEPTLRDLAARPRIVQARRR